MHATKGPEHTLELANLQNEELIGELLAVADKIAAKTKDSITFLLSFELYVCRACRLCES